MSLFPPISLLLFLMAAGRFASQANIRYFFVVPKNKSFILFANKIKPKDLPLNGKTDYIIQVNGLLLIV